MAVHATLYVAALAFCGVPVEVFNGSKGQSKSSKRYRVFLRETPEMLLHIKLTFFTLSRAHN